MSTDKRNCPDCHQPMGYDDFPEKFERVWYCRNPDCGIRSISEWNPLIEGDDWDAISTCHEVARKSGYSMATADECESGSLECTYCPWYKDESLICPECRSKNVSLYPHCNPFGDDTGHDLHCHECGYEGRVKSTTTWVLNANLILESSMSHSEIKSFLQNANMIGVMDMTVDMSLTQKQVDSVHEFKEGVGMDEEKSVAQDDREAFERFVIECIKNGYDVSHIQKLVWETLMDAVIKGKLRLIPQ